MSYSELIVSDSPIGYWELNSFNPTNVNIMSASTSTWASQTSASTTGIKSIIAGVNGGTSLNSASSIVIVPNYTYALKNNNQNIPLTMELWFTTINSSSQQYSLISPYSTSSLVYAFTCYIKNDKLWLESNGQYDYIAIPNFDDHQYLNISILNGTITANLNNIYRLSVKNSNLSKYDFEQFRIGPGNSDGPLFVNSFAIYKYILTSQQISKRLYYANYINGVNELYSRDGFSYFTGNQATRSLSPYNLISPDFLQFSFNKNISTDNNKIYLRKVPNFQVTTTSTTASSLYSLSASGIKLNSSTDGSSYIDLSQYMYNFTNDYSSIRMQIDVSSTDAGNLINFYGFDDYKSLAAEIIQSGGSKLQLTLTDKNDYVAQSVISPLITSGSHNILINFTTASVGILIDNVAVSGSISMASINGKLNSMTLGADKTSDFSLTNLIVKNNFYYGTEGWAAVGNITIQPSTQVDFFGHIPMKIISSGAGLSSIYYYNNGSLSVSTSNLILVSPSQTYVNQAYILPTASVVVDSRIIFLDSSLVQTSTGSVDGTNYIFNTPDSSSWTLVQASATAPSNAVYALPYFTASGIITSSFIFLGSPIFSKYSASLTGNAYTNYIRNFAIDEYSPTVSDYTSTGYLSLKFNNSLNVSQKGFLVGLIPNKTSSDSASEVYLTYSNNSSNIKIEYGKNSGNSVTWNTVKPNRPLPGYDFTSNSADQIKITMSNDNAVNEIESIERLTIKYLTSYLISTSDGQYSIQKGTAAQASLSFPIPTDIYSDHLSKSNNLGLAVIPNITTPILIPSSTSNPIQRADFLFKLNSLPSVTASTYKIFDTSGNDFYINVSSSGTIASIFPTGASAFIDGAYYNGSSSLINVGEVYNISLILPSTSKNLYLGSASDGSWVADASYGEIYISPNLTYYSSQGAFATKINTNLRAKETFVLSASSVPLKNNLDVNDGNIQTTIDQAKNYFSSDGQFFQMYAFPKIKITTKRSSSTIIR